MSENFNRMLRIPAELEAEFGRICKMIGVSKNAASNMLIAEFVLKYQGLERLEKVPVLSSDELVKRAIAQSLQEQERISNENDITMIPPRKKRKKVKDTPSKKKGDVNNAEGKKEAEEAQD